MQQRKKFETFNDGFVRVYREKPRPTDFNAKRNVATIDDMVFIARLDFEEKSRREQDLQFAEQNDFNLSLKIKTRLLKDIDNKCKAVIDGTLYDVSYLDKTRTEMYFYLSEVRKIDS